MSVAAPERAVETRTLDPVGGRRASAPAGTSGWWRVLCACAALFAIYGAFSLFNDSRGTLGTDTGGKLATLRAMDAHGGLDPDVGYWAERFDADGDLHPLFYTRHLGDRWVNLTTLPMTYAAYPLYELGGERAVLLIPMLGAVLSALAARALARRLGGERPGWWAFWLVGAASPVLVYALDFWEHSLGIATMLWAVVFIYDVVHRRAGWRGAAAAGALLGLAATMRTEAIVYTGLLALGALWLLARARVPGRTMGQLAVAGGGGLAIVLLANQALEQLTLGGSLRAARTAGTATAGASDVGRRVDEAATTLVGMNRFETPLDWIVGVLVALGVGYGVFRLFSSDADRRRFGVVVIGAAGLVYAVRFGAGLGFVPGLLTASPLVVAGLVFARERLDFVRLAVLALAALPIVWVFQYSGGAAPQWGSRYLLVSGALLATVAAVRLSELRAVRAFAVVGLAVVVTAAGAAWLAQRSHSVADGMREIDRIPADVLISRQAHLLREGGAFYDPDQRWLTALGDEELDAAFRVARDAGARSIAVVDGRGERAASAPEGFERSGTQHVQFLPSVTLQVVTYTEEESS